MALRFILVETNSEERVMDGFEYHVITISTLKELQKVSLILWFMILIKC